MTADKGTLDPSGPTLRFERFYEHRIEKVWTAVSRPEHQAIWFPQQILGAREPGAGARNGAGWHECIDRLSTVIVGSVPLPWGRRWHEVHPGYVAAFGPAASTLEAPEGWDRGLPADPYAPSFPRHAGRSGMLGRTRRLSSSR